MGNLRFVPIIVACFLAFVPARGFAMPYPTAPQDATAVGKSGPTPDGPVPDPRPAGSHPAYSARPGALGTGVAGDKASVLSPSVESAPCIPARPGSPTSGPTTFGRTYRVNDVDTWGDAVFETATGYLVLGDHSMPGGFAPYLTEFDAAGRPVRSLDLSIASGVPKSAIETSDGGYLVGSIYYPSSDAGEGRLVKLGSDLTVEWAKAIRSGSSSWSHVSGIVETVDGGYLALVRDENQIGILKLDSGGNTEWRKAIVPDNTVAKVTVYAVHENRYLDGDENEQCGGYVIYGGVYRTDPDTDWDLYLAAIGCDGDTLLWQRIVSGSAWEASYFQGNSFYDATTNLAVVADRNGSDSQDADLLLAAATGSYGVGGALMLVPLTISGGTTLSDPPAIGPVKILDGPDDDEVIGPYGGPNLISLSDGNLLLGGTIYSYGPPEARGLLVKMDAALNPIWQYVYGAEQVVAVREASPEILAAGGGPEGVLMRLAGDGSGEGGCVTRLPSALSLGDATPTVSTPTFILADGTFGVSDVAVTTTPATAEIICSDVIYLPIVVRAAE